MANFRTLPTTALQDTESAVRVTETMQLSCESFVAFLAAIDAPPEKNEALRLAFRAHSRSVVVGDPGSESGTCASTAFRVMGSVCWVRTLKSAAMPDAKKKPQVVKPGA